MKYDQKCELRNRYYYYYILLFYTLYNILYAIIVYNTVKCKILYKLYQTSCSLSYHLYYENWISMKLEYAMCDGIIFFFFFLVKYYFERMKSSFNICIFAFIIRNSFHHLFYLFSITKLWFWIIWYIFNPDFNLNIG